MSGCVFKRKLPSGSITWGYSIDAGKDENGKRKQIFKSGFETKGGASAAMRDAISEYETKVGRVLEEIGPFGRPSWAYILGVKKVDGFDTRRAAAEALTAEIARQKTEIEQQKLAA